MIQIIQVGSNEFNELINNVRLATIQTCIKELKQDDDLLTQEQAMELLKVKSKQKMKTIRDSKIIEHKMLGGEIRYSKKSIFDWFNRK